MSDGKKTNRLTFEQKLDLIRFLEQKKEWPDFVVAADEATKALGHRVSSYSVRGVAEHTKCVFLAAARRGRGVARPTKEEYDKLLGRVEAIERTLGMKLREDEKGADKNTA